MLANDVGVFYYNGDFYCKVLNYRNGEIVLSSYNPKHKDIIIDQPEELHFIGRVL
jgi:phage repressor protein C with HTH and peptisase S24 domain